MNAQELEEWDNTKIANLFVLKEYYHHHAYEILNTHSALRDDFKKSLTSVIAIETRVKRTGEKKSKGIKADFLNKEIRKLLHVIPNSDVKFEVNEKRGVFYFSAEKSSIGGFDFAILNHRKNLVALRNLCFGELHYDDGIARWEKFLKKNADFSAIADSLINAEGIGIDLEYEENDTDTPLLVGEIQFGNWALVYRDFFKVLKANVQNSIDCLIYIVPTGHLEMMLSNSIVTFDKTKKVLKDFTKVISVPVWIIGLDIQVDIQKVEIDESPINVQTLPK